MREKEKVRESSGHLKRQHQTVLLDPTKLSFTETC